MAFMCKKCRKAFRKDMSNYEESDEFCPHCDNHYVRAYLMYRYSPPPRGGRAALTAHFESATLRSSGVQDRWHICSEDGLYFEFAEIYPEIKELIISLPPQVIEAKTPQAVLGVEGDDPRINARYECHL
jgi:hypothetical protein